MEFSWVETGFLLHATMMQMRCGKKEVLQADPEIHGDYSNRPEQTDPEQQ
jgi:hypothetical protein